MSSSVTCHLEREDGSRWIVTAYDRDRDGATVCAVRELRRHAAAGDGGDRTAAGSPPPKAGEEDADGDEDGRTALWRTRLEAGDRLEWRAADGRVLASSVA